MALSIESRKNGPPTRDVQAHIVITGSRLIYLRGYKNTSINDICRAADIPKGSFYYHFGSKEDFAVQIIERHYESIRTRLEIYFSSTGGGYLDRLKEFFAENKRHLAEQNFSGGCPIGNLAQELSDVNHVLRGKLDETFDKVKSLFRLFLEKARENGETPLRFDPDEAANFIFNSWEGALVRMKVKKNASPLLLFEKYIFSGLLAS
jgi:TetR/AcrR family transcriptional repressor of nem operon